MKILFDQGTPVPLRRHLHPRRVDTASEMGWSELGNGELLAAAEEVGFELQTATDRNLRHQQNLAKRRIGVIVLTSTSWPRIAQKEQDVIAAVDRLPQGGYAEVTV